MQDFTLPANIKQIGSIGDGLRIYMEDYVCTFLHQYAESAGFEERLAFLVGKQMLIDGQQFLFIGGAIYGRYAEKNEGHLRFSEKSVDYAEEVLEEHFSGMEIVGWMQSQPSYGTYLNQYYAAYHLRQFRKPFQVMFVMDPLERTNAFYAANPAAVTPADRVAEIGGYFIYYEKNTNMHEYMLVNKSVDYTAKSPTLVELKPLEYVKEEEVNEPKIMGRREKTDEFDREKSPVKGYDDYYEPEDDRMEGRYSMGGPVQRGREPEEVIRRHEAAKARRRGTATEQKRATNLLAGLCAVLFLVSFVMGVSLVRNQETLQNHEAQIRQLTTALRDQAATTPVFAGDDSTVHVTTPDTIPVTGADPATVNANGEIQDIVAEIHEPPAITETTPEAIAAATPPPPTPVPQADATAAVTITGEEAALIGPIPESYTIQPGDSLLAISLRFFGDANMIYEIMALNGFDNPDHIVAGRTIALPRR
ncbi:MAG: LysM peptidoglycan-binding domain-containing protein [Defluviitaleaceae bacterium]|nr:LysM peptidoglycan-binding domain-containing protein [Defluviitaleaceae bacterium]